MHEYLGSISYIRMNIHEASNICMNIHGASDISYMNNCVASNISMNIYGISHIHMHKDVQSIESMHEYVQST